jgi:hypothetical protein
MSRLNILPEDILIEIYKECFKDTLLELQQRHIRRQLYNDVIEEINDIVEGLWCNFDFEDIVETEEDFEMIGFSHMMLLELHNILDLMIEDY